MRLFGLLQPEFIADKTKPSVGLLRPALLRADLLAAADDCGDRY